VLRNADPQTRHYDIAYQGVNGEMRKDETIRAMKQNAAGDSAARLRWFKEVRFEMFITWGLYSQLGRWEWMMHNKLIPKMIKHLPLARRQVTPLACAIERGVSVGRGELVLTTGDPRGFCSITPRDAFQMNDLVIGFPLAPPILRATGPAHLDNTGRAHPVQKRL
jgi:hypothetical protein